MLGGLDCAAPHPSMSGRYLCSELLTSVPGASGVFSVAGADAGVANGQKDIAERRCTSLPI